MRLIFLAVMWWEWGQDLRELGTGTRTGIPGWGGGWGQINSMRGEDWDRKSSPVSLSFSL